VLPPTLLRTGLRDLVRRPLQTGLLVLGVALGVAVVIAIDLANESARRGLERTSEAVAGRATHQVRGGPSGVSENFYRRLRTEWGYRQTTPVVEGVVVAPAFDRQPLTVLGVDPLSEGPFRSHPAGRAWTTPGFTRMLDEPDGVFIGSGLADRYGLAPGREIELQVGDRFATVRVLGILRTASAKDDALEGMMLMDVGAAQRLFGMEGSLSRVDLVLSKEKAESLRRRLPPDCDSFRPASSGNGGGPDRGFPAEPDRASACSLSSWACSSSTTPSCSAWCSGHQSSARCAHSG
jgi:putative ABC transport system permease protein